ncbi:hypothetical protein HYQ46_002027 [Verticillium longisporum]|nr:hypothetical protein HYQ46_002027 [Verticillium longisporum]
MPARRKGKCSLLADEEHINCAKVEVVEEGQRGKTVIGRMLTGIELLSLVLDNVTGSADLVSTSEAEEHQFIRWINRLFRDGGCHGGGLAFRRHCREQIE